MASSQEEAPQFGLVALRHMMNIWFFGFDLRLAGYSKRRGLAIGFETLEPVTFKIYEYARQMRPAQFMGAMSALNTARRHRGAYFTRHAVWLSPTTPSVAEPWGRYHLGHQNVSVDELPQKVMGPMVQYTLPHNIGRLFAVTPISIPCSVQLDSLFRVRLKSPPSACKPHRDWPSAILWR